MPTDLQLDTDFDLLIFNGDLSFGESTRQHQSLLLMTNYGEWRENPTVGIGAQIWLQDERDAANLAASIKNGFEADGMNVITVKSSLSNNKWMIQTEANYV